MQAGETLVAVSEAWCPYTCDPGSDMPGYLVEVMTEAFGQHGISVDYRKMPWTRALTGVESGQLDAILGVVEGNHGRSILCQESLDRDETVLVVRRGEVFDFAGPQDMEGKRIGVAADYTYDNNGRLDRYLLRRRYNQDRIVTIYSDGPLESLYAMLQSGRIDIFPENRHVALYGARKLSMEGEVEFVSTGMGDHVFIAFSPTARGTHLAGRLDEAIRIMREDGRLAAIQSRYGIGAGESPTPRGEPPR